MRVCLCERERERETDRQTEIDTHTNTHYILKFMQVLVQCNPYIVWSFGATVLDHVVSGPRIDVDIACIHTCK